jgi:hypothetical protein
MNGKNRKGGDGNGSNVLFMEHTARNDSVWDKRKHSPGMEFCQCFFHPSPANFLTASSGRPALAGHQGGHKAPMPDYQPAEKVQYYA